jgi:hypothetical protein
MRTITKALLCASLLTLISGTEANASSCVSTTLANYVAYLGSGGCTIGGLAFSDWDYYVLLPDGQDVDTANIYSYDIMVTPVNNALGVGFTYTAIDGGTFGLTTAAGEDASLEGRLNFLVSSNSGNPVIKNQSMSASDVVGPGGGTGDMVAVEDIQCYSGQIPLATCTGSAASLYNPFYGNHTYTNTFTPTSNVGVLEEWEFNTLFCCGPVGVTSFTDQYSVVSTPEPSCLLFLGSGLLALGWRGKTSRPVSARSLKVQEAPDKASACPR